AGVAKREEFLVHGFGHVPDDLAFVFVFWRVNIEKKSHDLRTTGSEFHGLPRFRLSETPDFGVVERAVLDLVHDVRPSPAGVNFIEKRAGRIVKPGSGRFLGLEMVPFESRPALQRIMMPGAAGKIFVNVKITMAEDIETGALLIADEHGKRILK